MFNIDRKYIDHETAEETLQSSIIYIRSKYRNDPALPRTSEFGKTDEEYEDYIDKKQEVIELDKTFKRKGPTILAVLFCAPPVVVNFYDKSSAGFYLSFLASIILVVLVIIAAKTIIRMRDVTDEKCDAYTEKLQKWYEEKKLEETSNA